jgi:four helix bundle protein
MMPYERFAAWKVAYALALEVYRVTKSFPKSELYGLTSQARRAAFSVIANIAEGAAKRGRAEFRRYVDIAQGSLWELSVTLRFARDVELLSPDAWRSLEDMRDHAGILTWRLYRSLGSSGPDRP